MPNALSPSTVDVVKATVPALETYGLAITHRMYERMFRDEHIRALFNQSHHGETGSQPKALAGAVLAYARNIDNLGVLTGAVERIAQKHVTLNILPEHYPFVADALLGAIKDVLGDAATEPVLAAWGEAYWFLAELLIGREAQIYRALATAPGGWNGWREFRVESVKQESAIIRSFVLVPIDGGPVVPHRPGQYLGVRLRVPGAGEMRRNYSVSCAPNGRAYRITVKREADPGVPPGRVSNWLHDHAMPGAVLSLAAPAGDFVLDQKTSAPVVLLSGGVGLTPLLSMLATIASEQPHRETWFVHAARNGRVHAMRDEVRELTAGKPAIRTRVFYDAPEAADRQGHEFDEPGFITAEWLAAHTPIKEGIFYLCGPKPFLRALTSGLADLGVPASRIRYEFFGPADELLDAPERQLAA